MVADMPDLIWLTCRFNRFTEQLQNFKPPSGGPPPQQYQQTFVIIIPDEYMRRRTLTGL
jgi:hypothetical protein